MLGKQLAVQNLDFKVRVEREACERKALWMFRAGQELVEAAEDALEILAGGSPVPPRCGRSPVPTRQLFARGLTTCS